MDNAYRKEILKSELELRTKEVTQYQVNVDNYRLAIVKIGNEEGLEDFKNYLENMLRSNILEKRKAEIMLEVIKDQLEK